MSTIIQLRTYNSPQINCIQLDNEISLVLMSGESDPGEPEASLAPEYFKNNRFNDIAV